MATTHYWGSDPWEDASSQIRRREKAQHDAALNDQYRRMVDGLRGQLTGHYLDTPYQEPKPDKQEKLLLLCK